LSGVFMSREQLEDVELGTWVGASRPQAHVSPVEFATINAVPFQIDGEVLYLEPDSGIIVDCAPRALTTSRPPGRTRVDLLK
jgi:hypothetical protein